MIDKFLFIGALPDEKNKHPGGQTTASRGLIQFCNANKINLEVIDSSQKSFPYPSILKRIYRAIYRNLKLVYKLTFNNYCGVIIFCGDGFSFFEKSLSCLFVRIFNKKVLLFLRSGFLIDEIRNSKIKRFFYPLLLNFPNKIIVQGEKWSAFLKSLNIPIKKIEIIHNWAERDILFKTKHKFKEKDSIVNFLFVGWLVKEKGIENILEALESSDLLKKQNFHFVGEGPLRNKIEELKIKNDFDMIKLHGWLKKKRVIKLMDNNDILVFPSYSEGFPNVIVEALSQGMPIITTDVGGISDSALHNQNAYIVPVRNSKALKKSMEKFVQNKDLIENFSKNSCKIFLKNHQNENCRKIFNNF